MIECWLSNYNVRRKDKIDVVVIHAARQRNAEELIKLLEERELSAHYVVDEKGEIYKLVPEDCRAWHAGAGTWNGESDINSNSIGIELCNGLFGEVSYKKPQMDALKELCLDIKDRYGIEANNFIGHSDMAPTRKIDPGSFFDWEDMAKSGIGVWYDLKKEITIEPVDCAKVLQEIGYGVEDIEATKWAFLRHYHPKLYRFLGGMKGANKGTIEGVKLEDNPLFLRTLCSVRDGFRKYKYNNKFENFYCAVNFR
ncbi:MAG: N-acetylmuramoyl-L-alanine amidase [Alphaproteobacteria bacterium]|nr:N-acetylmuramoyl-L-alanine amidase [Alphaproteobacteria bacterium]